MVDWTKTVEMMVIDYIQSKVFLYKDISLDDLRYEPQITKFLKDHGHHQGAPWMIRPFIEIVESE